MKCDNQYIKIEHWITELKLYRPADIIIFAYIYGFPHHKCFASLKTMAEWVNEKPQAVLDSLDRLQGIDPEEKKGRKGKKKKNLPVVILKEEIPRGRNHDCIYTSLVVHTDEQIKFIQPPNDNTVQAHSDTGPSEAMSDNQSDNQTDNQSDNQTGLICGPNLSDYQTASGLIIRHNNTNDIDKNTTTDVAVVSYSSNSVEKAIVSVCGSPVLSERTIKATARMLNESAYTDVDLNAYVTYVYDYAKKQHKGNLVGYFSSIVQLPAYLVNYVNSREQECIQPPSQHPCSICGYIHKDSDTECPRCHNTRDICNGDNVNKSIAIAEWKLHVADPHKSEEFEQRCAEVLTCCNPASKKDQDRLYSALIAQYLGPYLENNPA